MASCQQLGRAAQRRPDVVALAKLQAASVQRHPRRERKRHASRLGLDSPLSHNRCGKRVVGLSKGR